MNFEQPVLAGEVGEMFFTFEEGRTSKKFHHVGEFDELVGAFPVYFDNNSVEYMDLLGNFSSCPTEFAAKFYRFVNYERFSFLILRSSGISYFDCAVNWFPSKYLTNKKIQQIICEIEIERYKQMCRERRFNSIVESLRYRLYMKQCLRLKLKRAKFLSRNNEIVQEVSDELTAIQQICV